MGILVDKGRRRLAFILNITSTVSYWGSIMIFGIPLFDVHLRRIILTVLKALYESSLCGASIFHLFFYLPVVALGSRAVLFMLL